MMALTMATSEKGSPGTGPGLSFRSDKVTLKRERPAAVPALSRFSEAPATRRTFPLSERVSVSDTDRLAVSARSAGPG